MGRSFQQNYNGRESPKANALKAFGKVVGVTGAVAAVGGFGAGPALGLLADKTISGAASYYLNPSRDANDIRERMHDKIDFILTGDNIHENGGEVNTCSIRAYKNGASTIYFDVPEKDPHAIGSFEARQSYILKKERTPFKWADIDNDDLKKQFAAFTNARLCDSAISRLERIKFAFLLLGVLRQCEVKFNRRFNPTPDGNSGHAFPGNIAVQLRQHEPWIQAYFGNSPELKRTYFGDEDVPLHDVVPKVSQELKAWLSIYKEAKNVIEIATTGSSWGKVWGIVSGAEELGNTIYGTPGGMVGFQGADGGDVSGKWGSFDALWGNPLGGF